MGRGALSLHLLAVHGKPQVECRQEEGRKGSERWLRFAVVSEPSSLQLTVINEMEEYLGWFEKNSPNGRAE